MSPENNTAVQPLVDKSLVKLNDEQTAAVQAKVDRMTASITRSEAQTENKRKFVVDKVASIVAFVADYSAQPAEESAIRSAVASITLAEKQLEDAVDHVNATRKKSSEMVGPDHQGQLSFFLDEVVDTESAIRQEVKATAEAKAELRAFQLPAPIALSL